MKPGMYGLLVVALSLVAPAMAEDRALLVGVGKYQRPDNNLPGIDLDIDRMQDALGIMGFEPSQVRVLMDNQATAANIIRSLDDWLVDGVGPDDRVVFYYSGHGGFIPDLNEDEPDGVDEVLIAHDAGVTTIDGRRTVVNVVTDDRIGAMLDETASRNVLIVVDACHSGTVTRDIFLANRSLTDERVFEKAFVYDGMPLGSGSVISRSADGGDARDGFVGISAAGDDEMAIGTIRGGVFTIGFTEALKRYAQAGIEPSINQLRDDTEAYIRARLDPKRVHTPQITGDPDLAAGALRILPMDDGDGPIWQRLELLANGGRKFPLATSASTYRLGDIVEFSVNVPMDGYLNLVTVDSKDQATVLFPNEFDSDNFVKAGEFTFPTAENNFEFPASEPAGPTLVVAFITDSPLNFRDMGFDARLKSGEYPEGATFAEITYTATRALAVRLKIRPEPEMPPAADAAAAPEAAPEPADDGGEALYSAALKIEVTR